MSKCVYTPNMYSHLAGPPKETIGFSHTYHKNATLSTFVCLKNHDVTQHPTFKATGSNNQPEQPDN